MARWIRVLVGCLALAAQVGCAWLKGPAATKTEAPRKTITIGETQIDPADVTIGTSDAIEFASTASDPLQVEFIKPNDQTTKITCRVTDPKQLERGQKLWAEFRVSLEGHFTAYVPPGPFPSACSFIPGRYTYRVRVVDAQMRPLEAKPGQVGVITVK